MTSVAPEQPAAPEPSNAAPAPARAEAAPGGFFEWFWRGKSLRLARSFRQRLPLVVQERLRHAQIAAELADRACDPVDPLRAGSSLGLAISLYREAAYFALLAQSESYQARDLAALFDLVSQDFLELVAGGAEELRALRVALVDRSFVDTADLSSEHQKRDAQLARDFVHALLRHKLAPEARVGALLLQRSVRSLAAFLFLLGASLTVGLLVHRATQGPDLAAGKPWRASSSLDTCRPEEHYCAAAHTDIFFCTLEEKNPWVEFDLGKPQTFSRVDLTNRSDCCPDRAVPLAVEVSVDRENWREVSRRRDTFSTWQAKFAPQTARYVRIRALRRTILHLEKVSVRER